MSYQCRRCLRWSRSAPARLPVHGHVTPLRREASAAVTLRQNRRYLLPRKTLGIQDVRISHSLLVVMLNVIGTSLEDSLGSSTDLSSTLSSHSNSLSSEDDPSVSDILYSYSMDELLKRKLEKSPIRRFRASTIGICSLSHRRKSFDLTERPIDEGVDEEGSLYISPGIFLQRMISYIFSLVLLRGRRGRSTHNMHKYISCQSC